ncbi:hypothetical protein NPIL_156371 [Nephila pilipes]|uniref:Uncharacterized protein n=1 Tax=Nephila pilipes TaxID=299642 RepID=A0A8X6PUK6_NEPPI|nr:hypothetical protein NPIL_156371 [Nephila pilipes]
MDTFSVLNGWISRFKIRNGDDNNTDKEWLHVADDVSGVKFSDYISIDQDVAKCDIQSIEEMCDDAKNKNNGEEAEDIIICFFTIIMNIIHADEAGPTPVPSLPDAITVFETVRTFIYAREMTKKYQKML